MSQVSDLRSRLTQLKQSRSANARSLHGTSSMTPFTPLRGGFSRLAPIQPLIIGEEVALVNDCNALCLGKVGTGGTVCLKTLLDCDTESHSRKKGVLPTKTCLIQLKSEDKGYENVTLEVEKLEEEFVKDLMSKSNTDWVAEFAMIRANESTNASQRDLLDETLMTARKQKNFLSPKKQKAGDEFDTHLVMLDTSARLVSDVITLEVDDIGNALDKDLSFQEEAYIKNGNMLHDRVDILLEHANVVSNTIFSVQPFIESQVGPVEQLTSGLRLDIANVNARIGSRDLSRKDIPPCMWNAVENNFDSVKALEDRLGKISEVAYEAHEAANFLLTTESAYIAPTNKEGRTKDDSPKGVAGFTSSFNDKVLPSEVVDRNTIPLSLNTHAGGLCDHDENTCIKCFTAINKLDDKLTSASVRISNLEDAKSGNIDAAVLVKDRIYRGRQDITAELNGWFSDHGKKIDAGLFPTPHLILNLMHADMCSKTGPKIPLDQRDMIRHGIRRSDADAFYALQSDKPEFMITKDLCPNYVYKTTPAQKSSSTFKFLPSHEDFGNGLDSDSLHHKFKSSLEYVKGKSDRYIESSLSDHPDHRAYTVAKQLLDDSCKFIAQMLGFMEEVYTSCYDSFGASSEAWELVCHCVQEIFTKELKPSLKHCVAQDLVHVDSALVGVIHSAFSLNCKIRELTSVGLKNHHSTTTSHVRFVLKMAKADRKSDSSGSKGKSSSSNSAEVSRLEKIVAGLKEDNSDLKAHIKRVESRLDSFMAKMNSHLGTKTPTNKTGGKTKNKEDADGSNTKDSQ